MKRTNLLSLATLLALGAATLGGALTALATPPRAEGKPFDRAAATAALSQAAGAARSCRRDDGPKGSGTVKVTFAPSGSVSSASLQGPPFAGTTVGGCVVAAYRAARVPPFDGSPVTVSHRFSIN